MIKKITFLLMIGVSLQSSAEEKDVLTAKDVAVINNLANKFPPKIVSWTHTMDKEGRIILALKDLNSEIVGFCSEIELREFDCDFF